MKKIFLLLVASLLLVTAFPQNHHTIMKTQAMDMANALIKKDFTTFIKYMHPDIIKLAGGKDKALQRMDTVNAMATQLGATIKRIVIGNPGKIVNYKNQLQATLPETSEMNSGFGNLTLETILIAISTDAGKSWYFIDTSIYNLKDVKKAVPDLSPELVIPPATKPKFTPAQQ